MMMKKLLLLLLIPFSVLADTATITYDAPTEREDNTPLAPAEIAEFKVYDSNGLMVKQLPGEARSFDMPTTSAPQSLFITTVDTEDRESVYSQEATIPATVSNPKPVTNIRVTVTP